MHDFRKYVREHLPPLHVSAEREHEIVSELALQLEQAYEDALAEGLSASAALRRAESQLGAWESLAREINAAERTAPPVQRHARWFDGWLGDLRYALRFLRRNPGFASIAVLTLAFGIGGNTAIFTLVDAIALRSLPYWQPDRLVALETRKNQQPEVEPWTSALDLRDLREHARSFSSLAGVSPIWNVVLTGRGEAERLENLYVSASFFPLLGVKPLLGRTFTAEEDAGRPSPVAILGYELWQRRFGGSRDVLSQKITLDVGSYQVIGVMPADFRYAGEPVAGTAAHIDLWLPLSSNQLAGSPRSLRFLKVVGRLNPGVSVAQARDEVRRLGSALSDQYPETNRGFSYGVQSLSGAAVARYRVAMFLLLGTVGFVLLMACANVANLLLGRAVARQREIGVRVAMGASRFRLLRQLLTEGAVLAAAAGVAGLALAHLALRFLVQRGPEALVRTRPIHLDIRALGWTCTMVFLCALLAGLPPAWRMARAEVANGLRESGRSLTAGHRTLRSSLVVVQVAAALVLLVGAGLLIRSFQRLLNVDPGFDPRHLVTVTTLLPGIVRTRAQATAIYRQIHEQLSKTPGVVSVAAVSRLPLMGSNLGVWLYPEGRMVPGEPGFDTEYRVATPDYFATMGIALRAGRLFDEHDDSNAACCAVINEAGARRIFPGQDPVGKRIKLGSPAQRSPWVTIIGVVGNVRHVGLDVEPCPEVYRPYALSPLWNPILVIRTASDPGGLAATLAAKVRVTADLPAYNLFLMQQLVDRSTVERRFVMLLLSGFALAAMLLAAVGVYGTVAQAVTQRTPEIGLRMALGASSGSALLLVLREGMRLTAFGILAGAAAAGVLTQLMRNLLFEVRPLDAPAFAASATVLAGIALLACYLPARRATQVDPLSALRQE